MTKDEEIAELKAEIASLKKESPNKEAVEKIEEKKKQITKLVNEITRIADEHCIKVCFNAPFNQARGAGGMTYYPEGDPDRYDDEWSYCKPDSYGGWRSSATDMC